MRHSSQDLITEIDSAIQEYNRSKVESLGASLVLDIHNGGIPLDDQTGKNLLRRLQRKRFFGLVSHLAEALMQSGLDSFWVRQCYVQALIDRGELHAALAYLDALVANLEQVAGEEVKLATALGLRGRALKQIYVNIGASASQQAVLVLNQSIRAYIQAYKSNPQRFSWQGINSAALLLRAERDSVSVVDTPSPGCFGREIAGDVLRYMTTLWDDGRATMWDSGTALEACVALEEDDAAFRWLERYIREPLADAFEIGSTLRQLEEIWQLDSEHKPGRDLLPLLRAELLQRQGGVIEIDTGDIPPSAWDGPRESLEKVFGSARYHSYKFLIRAIDRARAVARIENSLGEAVGSGFLVRAADLHDSMGEDWVLLTNAHVVCNTLGVKDALAPEDTIITFQLQGEESHSAEEYKVTEVVWTSPPWKLDTSVLRLDKCPTVEPYPIHSRLPVPDGEQRVYIIGHPRGGSLSFSIQDNLLLDHQAPLLHYRTPTEDGSSGSPIFNAQWKLIGLHHAGSHRLRKLHGQSGSYSANEGIWIQSVRQALAKDLSSNN